MKNNITSIPAFDSLATMFTVHKKAGERKNCRLIREFSDIPDFLLVSMAVMVDIPNGSVTMIAVEGPATRKLPFFLAWEKTEKLQAGYGCWPKDNGWTTLDVTEDGRCFDKAADDSTMPRYKACRLVSQLPIHFLMKKSVSISKNGLVSVETSWGETRKHQLPADGSCEAILIEYEDGGCNILTLSEPSAEDYYVEVNGRDVGKLVDLIH